MNLISTSGLTRMLRSARWTHTLESLTSLLPDRWPPSPPPQTNDRASRSLHHPPRGHHDRLDTLRSLNTPRQHDTTTNNHRLQLRKPQVTSTTHEQPLPWSQNPLGFGLPLPRPEIVHVVSAESMAPDGVAHTMAQVPPLTPPPRRARQPGRGVGQEWIKIKPCPGRHISKSRRDAAGQRAQTSRSETVYRLPAAGPATRSGKVGHFAISSPPALMSTLRTPRRGRPLLHPHAERSKRSRDHLHPLPT